jgi:cytochrome c biogenesis protein ResB
VKPLLGDPDIFVQKGVGWCLRETGNLVFHASLVGVLVSVGVGGGFAYTGQQVIIEGQVAAQHLPERGAALKLVLKNGKLSLIQGAVHIAVNPGLMLGGQLFKSVLHEGEAVCSLLSMQCMRSLRSRLRRM